MFQILSLFSVPPSGLFFKILLTLSSSPAVLDVTGLTYLF